MEHNHAFWLLEHLAFFQDKPRSGIASVHFHHFLHQVGRVLHRFSPLWKLALCSVYNDIYIYTFQSVRFIRLFRASFVKKWRYTEIRRGKLNKSEGNCNFNPLLRSRSGIPLWHFHWEIWKIQKGPYLGCHKHEQPSSERVYESRNHTVPWCSMAWNDYWLHHITSDYCIWWLAMTCTCFILTEPSSLHLVGVCEFQQEAPWDTKQTRSN